MNEKNEAVMMGWEKPLMVEHAKEICLRGRSYDDVMALEVWRGHFKLRSCYSLRDDFCISLIKSQG